MSSKLSKIEESLKKTTEEQKLEQRLLNYQKKVRDFGVLLDYHLPPRNIFDFLEKITHPKVWFSSFSFNLEENKVSLSGQTDTFITLGQQIIILRNQDFIKDIDLSDISIDKDGKVGFNLQVSFNKEIFK
jgi:hypothetical protein